MVSTKEEMFYEEVKVFVEMTVLESSLYVAYTVYSDSVHLGISLQT